MDRPAPLVAGYAIVVARAGDEIDNPITGERVIFRLTSADTHGELLEMDLSVRPHGPVLMEHLHMKQEERFEMLSGELSFKIDGRARSATRDDVVVIPPGTRHQWWNSGDEIARATLVLRPAMKFETVMETMFGLARDGKTTPGASPTCSRSQCSPRSPMATYRTPDRGAKDRFPCTGCRRSPLRLSRTL